MTTQIMLDELKTHASFQHKTSSERFFKSGVGEYSQHDIFIGVRMRDIRKIAKKYYKETRLDEISKILNNQIHEVRHLGLILLLNKYTSGQKEKVFECYLENIQAVNNWDLVDTTAPHILGDFIFLHQDKLNILYQYAKSENLWLKRIAIVATFSFIKQSEFKPTITVAKTLLNDKHDLIHKAIGWMLREVYKKNADTAEQFLKQNYAQLPRTTLRYAIERMNDHKRQAYLRGDFNVSN